MRHRTILSLCDYSGIWSGPYAEAGYEVVRVDLQHGRDVRLMEFPGRVHGILAAPPCTAFSKAGAWMWAEKDADGRTLEGLSVVDACLRLVVMCRPEWWALENPAGRLKRWLGPASWSFQPCDFGDGWTKRTYLWGNFTPPAPLYCPAAVAVAPTRGDITTRMSSKATNARSETPPGFATAFYQANP
jgi:hypothetical protein